MYECTITTTEGNNFPELAKNYILRNKDFLLEERSPTESMLSPVGTIFMIGTNRINTFKIIYRLCIKDNFCTYPKKDLLSTHYVN